MEQQVAACIQLFIDSPEMTKWIIATTVFDVSALVFIIKEWKEFRK